MNGKPVKASVDKCRQCGKAVRFITNGRGGIVAVDDSGSAHPCKDA
jgi:hypothetical protein